MEGDEPIASLLLLSGGIDSAAIAWWMKPAAALTINYGQRAAVAEMRAAAHMARELGIPHHTIALDLRSLGQGLMASDTLQHQLASTKEWWPFRNQLLITVGAMFAIRDKLDAVLIGTVSGDTRHRDGTPEFLAAMQTLLCLQEGAVSVIAPARGLSTVELLRISNAPESFIRWAHSCHRSCSACGSCPGCIKYKETMATMGW